MTDAVRSTKAPAQQPTANRVVAPAAPAAKPAVGKMADDSFDFDKAPSAQKLAGWKAAVAALDTLPKKPSGRDEQRAWVAAVSPKLEAAEKALNELDSAAFFHKAVPEAEIDALRSKVSGLRSKVEDTKEASGLVAPTKPASPFRPLGQTKDWAVSLMQSNPFLAVIGVVALIPAIIIDGIDAVTRPLQAIAYPFFRGQYEVRQNAWEKEHPSAPAR